MSTITADLAALLATVLRPGDFYTSGTTELLPPSLRVDGVGPVALPLLQIQAEKLIAVAEAAPFGRGQQTLVDPTVRRTWQIGPDRVHIQGRHWDRILAAIVARVADGLGVSEPIDAEFYKLLIYDEGSFFVGHRDTEKAPGMFATMVIVLPSTSSGGELVVRHSGREARLDLQCEDPSEAAFAAFYADCVHEVLPITAGCRLTLVYNLLRRGRGRPPGPPSYDREQTRVATLLREWGEGKTAPARGLPSDGGTPEKLVYPLEHAYTQAELGFATLKGADAAVAGVLASAAPQAGCELHLALVTVEESGTAEYSGYYGRGRGSSGPDEDDFEAGEVDDRAVSLSEWRTPDASPSALGALPVKDEELSPPGAFDDLEFDEEHFQEATGNEGATFERTYRRAALVLWPRNRTAAVLCQAGLSITLPYLEDIVERWAGGGGDRRSALWQEAHDLAGHMIEQWPIQHWYPRQDATLSDAARMLGMLARLEDADRIETFVTQVTATGVYGKGDNEAILAGLRGLPAARQTALLELIVERAAATSFGACANLLARAVGGSADLHRGATRLVGAMPGDPARSPPEPAWQRRPEMESPAVADLLTALVATDRTLAERAARHILMWPKTYDLDRTVVPAMRTLVQSVSRGTAIEPLRDACLAHLRARIAEPLAPPTDWRRASAVSCQCVHCKQLSAYLADPTQKVWDFRAAEQHRAHVAATIRGSHVDLDTATDRRGRPYGLVCTKNQASYERRAKQRTQDLADLTRLGG
jgi:predicted 2-oxoglutarate/Fe(II)-dependent dioxygenase YbiX